MEENLRILLGKIGMIGLRSGLAKDAAVLFQGLSGLNPDRSGPVIGLAMAYLADDRPTEAMALLEPLPDPEARLYLGMAHRLRGEEDKAAAIWSALAAAGDDETARAARSFMAVERTGINPAGTGRYEGGI